jgi:cytosine/adenosine deaminase-related metal-dependent hydrolase
MATSWPARADGDRGRIAVRCRADLSAFDRDRATAPEDWGEIEPVVTIVDGSVAWAR